MVRLLECLHCSKYLKKTCFWNGIEMINYVNAIDGIDEMNGTDLRQGKEDGQEGWWDER